MNINWIERHFSIGHYPPILSHLFVFFVTIAVMLDVLQISTVPLKISKNKVLYRVSDKRWAGDSLMKVGETARLFRNINDPKAKCAVPAIRAIVYQVEQQFILLIDKADFKSLLNVNPKHPYMWSNSSVAADDCEASWEIEYG